MLAIQISPSYPPEISGVGDYAALLTSAFSMAGQIVETVVPPSQDKLTPSYGVIALDSAEASTLAQTLMHTETVLLHFSGYGYARRGLCHWLVDGLKAWKQAGKGHRLITIFHEVYATGPIWRASFWTASAQRRIASDLAHLSDSAFTTSQVSYERLKSLRPELPLQVLPVFSNVGEPKSVNPLHNRDPLAVVFGGAGRRTKLYADLAQQTENLAKGFQLLGITEIIDIGPKVTVPETLAGYPVRTLGSLPAQEVSTWLSRSRIGLIDYPLHVLTKSGIAAAYFSHALLVVNTSQIGRLPDDLQEGREIVSLRQLEKSKLEPQSVATAGWTWYQPHNLEATAHTITSSLSR